jgi:hypothetical protein
LDEPDDDDEPLPSADDELVEGRAHDPNELVVFAARFGWPLLCDADDDEFE